MTKRERFLIGGVGGLAPVLMFLATGDFERFFANFAVAMAVGYFVRAIVLFFVGGFVAGLYQNEAERIKVFQLGLGAPAMIAGFLLASSSKPSTVASLFSGHPVEVVYAQTVGQEDAFRRFTLPAAGPFDQFLEGLTGSKPQNVWFVIAGSFSNPDLAKGYAKTINGRFRGFHADVYAPYADSPNYAVVIGANLTQSDAKKLRDKAVAAGMTRQTYYKTFPNLPAAPSN